MIYAAHAYTDCVGFRRADTLWYMKMAGLIWQTIELEASDVRICRSVVTHELQAMRGEERTARKWQVVNSQVRGITVAFDPFHAHSSTSGSIVPTQYVLHI